jgi:hypothetical protein
MSQRTEAAHETNSPLKACQMPIPHRAYHRKTYTNIFGTSDIISCIKQSNNIKKHKRDELTKNYRIVIFWDNKNIQEQNYR